MASDGAQVPADRASKTAGSMVTLEATCLRAVPISFALGDSRRGGRMPHSCPSGQACIRGTRVPVHQIVRMLANGTIEGLLEAYPSITREDIAACLKYAASLSGD